MDSDSDVDVVDTKPKEAKQKSRRPPNTAFRQQRLKAWQPILTPKTVLPLFFCLAIVFCPLGGALLYASNQVQELVINYSHCQNLTPSSTFTTMPAEYVTSQVFSGGKMPASAPQWRLEETSPGSAQSGGTSGVGSSFPPGSEGAAATTKKCIIQFNIPTEMGSPIFLFYRMTNFYQNHRRYVQSFNEDQLTGDAVTNSSLKSVDDCTPLTLNHEGKAYYPCGLIANSFFNDTFSSLTLLNPNSNSQNETYHMTDEGIAWPTDKNRFKKTTYTNDQVVPPPNWAKMYPDGYTDKNPIPDISQWEALQNWMRTAGLPTFSKLALRNDTTPLQSGTYQISIGLNFPVLEYEGTKSIVLSTRTVIGGRNPFLGIAYIVVGGLCFVLGLLFLIKHIIRPRKLGDHSYLSWNQDAAPGGAQASAIDTGSMHRRH